MFPHVEDRIENRGVIDGKEQKRQNLKRMQFLSKFAELRSMRYMRDWEEKKKKKKPQASIMKKEPPAPQTTDSGGGQGEKE